MPGMREYNREKSLKCREYYIAHPDESISQVAKANNVSERTAASVRAALVKEGILSAGRSAEPAPEPAPLPKLPTEKVNRRTKPVAIPNTIIDDAALAKIAAEGASGGDTSLLDIDFDNLDDETIRKKLLKGVILIAFKPGVHPDVQLAATQVWVKLKDMARAKELGPGKPKTRAEAIKRLTELLIAVGPEIAIEAMTIAFNVKESSDATTPSPEADPSSVAASSLPPLAEDDPIAPPYDS